MDGVGINFILHTHPGQVIFVSDPENQPGGRYLVTVLGIQIFIFLVLVSVLGLMICYLTDTTGNFCPRFLVGPGASWFAGGSLVRKKKEKKINEEGKKNGSLILHQQFCMIKQIFLGLATI